MKLTAAHRLLGGVVLAAAGSALVGTPVLAQSYGSPREVEVVEVVSPNGWYLTIGAGAAWPSSQGYSGRGVDPIRNQLFDRPAFSPFRTSGDIDFGGGFSGDVGIGYDFGAIRTELTYVYSNAYVDDVSGHVSIDGIRALDYDLDASGSVNKHDVMLSVYWDVLSDSRWTPYIGGGIGYTNLSTPGVKIGGERIGDASQGLFGWQAKAGVSYAISTSWDIYGEGTYSGASGFDSDRVDYDSFNNWGAKLGFRYRFGQPAEEVVVIEEPAPMPEPTPMPQPEPMPMPEPAPIRGLW